jgi:rRNA biogenesis protein RRP5
MHADLGSNMQDELAQQVIKAMCRKFGGSAKVWLRAYGHAAGRGDAEGARKTLDKAMSSLLKRKHIKARLLSPLSGLYRMCCV